MNFPEKLRKEIKQWTRDGLLSEDSARQILQRYPDVAASSDSSRYTAVARTLGVIGALLIGLGIILIFAYNWKSLPQAAKLALAFVPLSAGLLLAAYTLARKPESIPWRESVGIAVGMSAAACLGLVAQTLQLQSDLASFYFTWQLCCLPLLFALKARSLYALLCLLSICWAATSNDAAGHLLPLRAAAATVPLFAYLLWERASLRSTFSRFAFIVSTIWIVSILAWPVLPFLPPTTGFALITATFYLWLYRTEEHGRGKRLFTFNEAACKIALTIVALILTFENAWSVTTSRLFEPHWLGYALTAAVAAFYLRELWKTRSRSTWHDWPWALLPIAIAGISPLLPDMPASLLMIAYVGLMAVAGIHQGYATHSIARLNHGLAIMLVLAATRFFDDDFSMLLRGGAFIAVGIVFLAANLHFLKRKTEARHESA